MKLKNILAIIALIGTLPVFAQIDRSKLPEPATPRPIEIGDYESFELKNGLKVYIIENHKLPRVSYSLQFDLDPILEGDKVGYLSMMGQMLRRGTETRTKEQLDEEIDFIGASLAASSSSVFASGLSKYEEKILELMTDVLFNPTFPEEELEKIRTQTISGLAANKEDPNAIMSNLNRKIVYGSDHPYGEFQTEETVANITVEDLVNHHSTYFKPNVAYLAIVGDVDPKKTKKLIKSYFKNWEAGEIPKMTYDTPQAPEKRQVNIVNRSSSVQSVINVTYPVVLPVGDSDVIPVRVMNGILGGTGSAKLFMNLREDKGYTYGSYSSLSSDELVSRFRATAEVRNEVTDSSLVEFFYEMQQMIDGNISDDELNLAKNSIAGSFSRSLERPQTVANFAVNTAIYGLPEDYYATYIQKLQAVTKDDVVAMAKKYIKPDNSYINIVGKAGEIADKVASFGDVKYFDIYGNEVDPALAKLPEGLTVESVLAKYKEAIGGDEALANVKNVTLKMEAEMMGQKLNMDYVMADGKKSSVTVSMGPMTAMKAVSNGSDAMTLQMGNKLPMDDASKEEIAFANGIFTEFDLEEVGAEMQLSGLEQINDKDAYGVEVTLPKGSKYTLYFDAETGLKVRYSKTLETPQGVFTQNVDYKDYKEVDGIMVFHQMVQQMGPQKIDSKATEVLVNQDLPEDTFKVE